jgi:ABC-type antimicrobial peptide transport system permease subunit
VASQLHGVSPYDGLTFAAVVLLLAVVSAIAALLPALRAARVDPLTALKYE